MAAFWGLTPEERPGRSQEWGCVSEVEGLGLELGVMSDSGACALQVLESRGDRGLRHFCQGCLWWWRGPQDEPGRPGCVGGGEGCSQTILGERGMPSRSQVGPESSRQELRGAEETDWGASWVQGHPQWQASCCHPRSSLTADGVAPGGGV